MNPYGLVKVLHLLAVTALISGTVGRALIRARLLRLDDIHIVREFIQLEGHFDEWLVVRGSIATLLTGLLLTWLGHWPLVIWVYIPRGQVFGTVFQDALAQKRVTVELRAALSDQVIRASYLYEYLMLPVVMTLMVIKPF